MALGLVRPGDQQFGSSWPLIAVRNASSCTDAPACVNQTDEPAAGDFFGYSVDVSGWTAIVGAFGGGSAAGAAYIFERNWDGVFNNNQASMWQVSKKLVAPDSETGLYFGFSVALDGSYAVVTANKEADGRAYLFGRNYGGLNNWGYIKTITAPSTSTDTAGQVHLLNYWSDSKGDFQNGELTKHLVPYYEDYTVTSVTVSSNFGAGSAISGSTVAVASPYADTSGQDTGEIILTAIQPSRRQSRKKVVEQTLSASDVSDGDRYGRHRHRPCACPSSPFLSRIPPLVLLCCSPLTLVFVSRIRCARSSRWEIRDGWGTQGIGFGGHGGWGCLPPPETALAGLDSACQAIRVRPGTVCFLWYPFPPAVRSWSHL